MSRLAKREIDDALRRPRGKHQPEVCAGLRGSKIEPEIDLGEDRHTRGVRSHRFRLLIAVTITTEPGLDVGGITDIRSVERKRHLGARHRRADGRLDNPST